MFLGCHRFSYNNVSYPVSNPFFCTDFSAASVWSEAEGWQGTEPDREAAAPSDVSVPVRTERMYLEVCAERDGRALGRVSLPAVPMCGCFVERDQVRPFNLKRMSLKCSLIVCTCAFISRCNWQGLQHEIEDHLAKGHKELGEVFRFRESTSLVFKEQISLGGLKLVDAFSKRFLFYFFSDVAHKKLSFLMLYFGRREEAAQYCYELEISGRPFAPPANGTDKEATTIPPVVEDDAPDASVFSRTVKFVERCNSDSENLAELLDEERCVSLSHRQVKNYLHEGKLHMRYRVRKVDGGGREKKLSGTVVPAGEDPPLGSAAPVKPKPRPPPFVFAKKGTLAGPGKRSSSSSSSSSNTSSSSSSSSTSKSESSTGSGKTVQSTASVASRSPSTASTITISSERNSGDSGQLAAAGAMDSRHSLSSINRLTTPLTPFEKPEQCPLMTPSINKHDVVSGGGNVGGGIRAARSKQNAIDKKLAFHRYMQESRKGKK